MWTPPDDPITIKPEFVDTLAKLETAGGTKTIKGPNGEDSYNLFNIKGPGFRARDKVEGSNDTYRTYASPEESKADLTSLLVRRYPKVLDAKTPEEFAKALKDGGYATDPDYVKKFVNIAGKGSTGWVPPSGDTLVDGPAWTPPKGDSLVDSKPATVVAPTPKQETSTGSKAESGLRGAIQGATGGFGDEISSFIRAYSPVQIDARTDANGRTSPVLGLNKDFGEYTKLRDEQRAANTASSAANPLTYGAANIAASAPQFLAAGAANTALGAAARGAAIQGAAGFGGAEGDLANQALTAGKQAVIGGIASGGGKVLSNLGGEIKSAAQANFAKPVTDLTKAVDRLNPFVSGSKSAGAAGVVLDKGLGAGAGYLAGKQVGFPKAGALVGGMAGVTGISRAGDAITGGALKNAISAVTKGADWAMKGKVGEVVGPAVNTAYQMALVNMTKGQAKPIVKQGEMQIMQRVEAGTPAYAAEAMALNNPAYRVAKETEEDDSKDEDENPDE